MVYLLLVKVVVVDQVVLLVLMVNPSLIIMVLVDQVEFLVEEAVVDTPIQVVEMVLVEKVD